MGRFSNAAMRKAVRGRARLVFYQSGEGIRKGSRAGSSRCPMPNRKSRETGGCKLYRK